MFKLLRSLFDSNCNSNCHNNPMGLFPAPPTRETRGYYEEKPSPNLYFSVFMCFARALWTQCGRKFVHIYIHVISILSLYRLISFTLR